MSTMQPPLTDVQLMALAPTLFTEQPHKDVSEKYHFIPTMQVVDQIREHNWHPVYVQESMVRDSNKEGYQRHLVRFRHFDDLLYPKENAIELLLFNSHDRSTAFSISAGIFRFVCSNGLVVADSLFESHKIKHLGSKSDDVVRAVERVTDFSPKIQYKIDIFESIILSHQEQMSFAKTAMPLRFEPQHKIEVDDLLLAHRKEDEKSDLYTTMNRIQENLIRGNIQGFNKETGRRFTSKAINSIQRDTQINKGLWSLAERIAAIKEPSLLQAA